MAATPETIAELNGLARDFYQARLAGNREAQALFRARGLSDETIAHWQLGYGPSGSSLLRHLAEKGWGEGALIEAGLVVSGARGAVDFHRDRLIFPIPDTDGVRILGFGSRRMRDDDPDVPKYLNGPDTPLFHKRELLYGLPNAADIHRSGTIFIVEGNFDMLGLWNAGVRNVAAALGTALTVEHLALLHGLASRIDLVLDADAAGQAATVRSLLLDGIDAFDVGVVPLTGGKDPDVIVREDPEAWGRLLASRRSRWEHLWQVTLAPYSARLDSDVEARVAWKEAWARLVHEHAADRAIGRKLLGRLGRRLGLPPALLDGEYLAELPAASAERDELLLVALARHWSERAILAPLIPLGKGAAAVREVWLRRGKPELSGRLATRAAQEADEAEAILQIGLRGELRGRIEARLSELASSAPKADEASRMEISREARALRSFLHGQP